jgi:hypothetical protein
MTTKAAPPAKTPRKRAKTAAKKGSAPAVKAAKRPAVGANRGRAGTTRSAGAKLRAELTQDGDRVGVTVLIRQAARVADRLEAIDKLLSGDADAWAVVGIPRTDTKRGRVVVEVKVDNLMVEERSQTTLFRHLLGEIHKQRAGVTTPSTPGDDDDDLDV